jgi:Fe2+ transport system protein FeoA
VQLGGNKVAVFTLADLHRGQHGVVEKLDLPEDVAHRLMILGFVPGVSVEYTQRAPGGDPRVFRVDGSEIALRGETASRIHVTPQP